MTVSITYTFTPNNTRFCFEVEITDDGFLENEENFTVTLTSNDTMVDLSPDDATITITDNNRTLIIKYQKCKQTYLCTTFNF